MQHLLPSQPVDEIRIYKDNVGIICEGVAATLYAEFEIVSGGERFPYPTPLCLSELRKLIGKRFTSWTKLPTTFEIEFEDIKLVLLLGMSEDGDTVVINHIAAHEMLAW